MSLVVHVTKLIGSRNFVAEPPDLWIKRDLRDPLLTIFIRGHLANGIVLVRIADKAILRHNPQK